jgi:hypothetical protein
MSETLPTSPPTSTPIPAPTAAEPWKPEPFWAKPSIGILSFALLAAALFVTWKYDKDQPFNLLIGAVIANATTVINYYFGSSSGSAQKTALLTTPPPPRPGGG